MSIEFKDIPTDFQSIKPFKIYKTWRFDDNQFTVSDPSGGIIQILDGPANYPINSYIDTNNGQQSGSVWYSVRNLFYGKISSSDVGIFLEPNGAGVLPVYYDEFTKTNFTGSVIVYSIPQTHFGEGIQPSTVLLVDQSSVNPKYGYTGENNIIDDGKGNLFDTLNPNFTGSVGNISYDFGLLIITDPQYYTDFSNSLFIASPLNLVGHLNYTSFYTAHEHEYICLVKSFEYNHTFNPTAYTPGADGKPVFRFADILDASGSQVIFKPLTTGIELCDATGKGVVFAKFAKPIRIENDMDSIFIVRFDT